MTAKSSCISDISSCRLLAKHFSHCAGCQAGGDVVMGKVDLGAVILVTILCNHMYN